MLQGGFAPHPSASRRHDFGKHIGDGAAPGTVHPGYGNQDGKFVLNAGPLRLEQLHAQVVFKSCIFLCRITPAQCRGLKHGALLSSTASSQREGPIIARLSIDYCLRRLRASPHERKLIPSRKGAPPAESFWPWQMPVIRDDCLQSQGNVFLKRFKSRKAPHISS